MGSLRIYLDTSVVGGCFDEEFAGDSKAFFNVVLEGRVTALISDTLVGELVKAPEAAQNLLQRVLNAGCERLALTQGAERLRDAYIAAAVVSARYADDALHVAHATLARADVIVSWNFKHLVNPSQVRAFSGVNIAQGYGAIVIMTPSDIVKMLEASDEEE